MKQTFYTIYDQQNYKPKSKLFDHYICENEKTRIIVPITFHKNSINVLKENRQLCDLFKNNTFSGYYFFNMWFICIFSIL